MNKRMGSGGEVMNIEISLTAFMPNITMLLFTTGNPTSK
jgi:hypothetical protein